MKILIQDTVVETKDIAAIVDVEAHKTMFLNREAGFKIIFLDNSVKVFGERIPYETYPHQIQSIKMKWDRLMEDAIAKWNQDKTEITKIV